MADAWYRHRFYRFKPDLNTDNPAVREEIRKIATFWLTLGVSGFRIDAAPFLIEPMPPALLSWSCPLIPDESMAPSTCRISCSNPTKA